jgi:hypothetical protein
MTLAALSDRHAGVLRAKYLDGLAGFRELPTERFGFIRQH